MGQQSFRTERQRGALLSEAGRRTCEPPAGAGADTATFCALSFDLDQRQLLTAAPHVPPVNCGAICTPSYRVARCLLVRNRCLQLGGSGVGLELALVVRNSWRG